MLSRLSHYRLYMCNIPFGYITFKIGLVMWVICSNQMTCVLLYQDPRVRSLVDSLVWQLHQLPNQPSQRTLTIRKPLVPAPRSLEPLTLMQWSARPVGVLSVRCPLHLSSQSQGLDQVLQENQVQKTHYKHLTNIEQEIKNKHRTRDQEAVSLDVLGLISHLGR